MHTALPKMAKVVALLRNLLEKVLGGGKHTNRVAKNKPITKEHWTSEWQEAWGAALGVLRDAVKLAYPKRGWTMLMFPDVSDLFWGSMLTKVSSEDYASRNTVEKWHHEPLGLMSGVFKVSQRR